jgi:ring-1,2-phenylacetyl-CoA epoxidase subunit PaaC
MTVISTAEDLSAGSRQSLANWLTAVSDTKHLLGLRYAEWCTGGPELEANIAASAMAQFELGHARVLRGVLNDLSEDPRGDSRDTDRSMWFSIGALDRPFADWVDLVVGNALVDTLLTVNLRAALAGNYYPLTQRLRKVLAEEEYHSVHAGAWVGRLASGPPAIVERLNEVTAAVWPHCIAWFGPNSDNELDELHDAKILTDGAADLRDRYIETVSPMFEGASMCSVDAADIDWDGWNKVGRRHGVPAFDDDCFAMITGANTRAVDAGG